MASQLLDGAKVARFSAALQRYREAFVSIAPELAVLGFASLVLLYLSAMGIYYFENEAQPEAFSSVFSSLSWAVATLTTVGYGDVYPVTVGGKIFTVAVVMLGLGVVAVPSGLLAVALQRTVRREEYWNSVKVSHFYPKFTGKDLIPRGENIGNSIRFRWHALTHLWLPWPNPPTNHR